MTLRSLIWKELRQRPWAVATSLLAISLGVGALVAIRSVTVFSEQAVAQKMATLGANVLLLPKDVSLQDYYAADLHGKTLPEEHATRLAMANLEGVEGISPKLCVPAELNGRKLTLTGILPQSEFQAQAAWQSLNLFSNKHAGCKKRTSFHTGDSSSAESLINERRVQELGTDEILVGADVAQIVELTRGERIKLCDRSFTVAAVLPPTGTIDDSRVFAHLHTVQEVAAAGPIVNVIELMACCEDAAGSLIPNLAAMFDDAKVITISNVVETQVSVNRLMARLSYVFLVILVGVSAASVAGTMFANVRERRREIGTFMALGATRSWVARLFLGKALLVGLLGGIIGFTFGTLTAVFVGPRLAGVVVQPLPSLAAVSVVLAGAVALIASYLPARRATQIDPCLCFREI
ncbi:MAG: ABC transporter permease [Pirellulales bacterium]|nr:ABC transporter permease [Pirellulales bacterium]